MDLHEFAAHARKLPNDARKKLLAELPKETLAKLSRTWEWQARNNQLAPEGEWFVWIVCAGRGYGKTSVGSNWIANKLREARKQGEPITVALVGATANDALNVMIRGESGLMRACADLKPNLKMNQRRIDFPDGSVVLYFSDDEPDQAAGANLHYAWLDEAALFSNLGQTYQQVSFALRRGDHPQILLTTTPRANPFFGSLLERDSTVITYGSTYENAANLPQSFLDEVSKTYLGTSAGDTEIYGRMPDLGNGFLFKKEWFKTKNPERDSEGRFGLSRIVVAIDPATTTNKDSNETGIVVCGVDSAGMGYLLADHSGKYTPDQWAHIAISLYEAYGADKIIAEINQGGQMVETILRTIDRTIPYQGVYASRGKITRAEPIASLYERGLIAHTYLMGDANSTPRKIAFPELEKQMIGYEPGKPSPDRLDALVWGFSYLMLNNPSARGVLTYNVGLF